MKNISLKSPISFDQDILEQSLAVERDSLGKNLAKSNSCDIILVMPVSNNYLDWLLPSDFWDYYTKILVKEVNISTDTISYYVVSKDKSKFINSIPWVKDR